MATQIKLKTVQGLDLDQELKGIQSRYEEGRKQRSDWLEKAKETGEDGRSQSQVTMWDYVKAGVNEPWIFDDAHQRIFRVLFAEPGILRLNYDTFPQWAKSIGLTQDQELYLPVRFLDEFYGIDPLLHKYLLFVLNGARGGEAQRQMLFMYGAAGTGKSQLAEASKRYLTEAVMFRLEGCPISDHPLWLVPKNERARLSSRLGARISGDKDICPKCREVLKKEYGYRWHEFKIEAVTVSMRRKRGIDVVPPFDPNTMGSEVLIGYDEFWRKETDKYLRWVYGAMGNANGGILEFREFFKAPREAHHLMYMYTQEQQFPSPKYLEYCFSNALVIAHTNIPDVTSRKRSSENDAFFDRVYSDFALYPMSLDADTKIFEKMLARAEVPQVLTDKEHERIEAERAKIKKSFLVPNPLALIYDRDVKAHRSLGALALAAEIKKISHLMPKTGEGDMAKLLHDMKIISGKVDASAEEVRRVKGEYPLAGLHGFSPRFAVKDIEDAIAEALLRWRPAEGSLAGVEMQEEGRRSMPCIDIEDVRRAFLRKFEHEMMLALEGDSRQDQNRLQAIINMLKADLWKDTEAEVKFIVLKDLERSGILDEALGASARTERKKTGCEEYIEHARRFTRSRAMGDTSYKNINLSYLADVERQIERILKISLGNAEVFREKLVNIWDKRVSQRQNLAEVSGEDANELTVLEQAVEHYIYASEHQQWLNRAVEHMRTWMYNKQIFRDRILAKLPDYYCSRCFPRLWRILLDTNIKINMS